MARVSCQYSISAAPSTTAMAAYTQTEPAISAASTTAIRTAAVPIRTAMLERRAPLSAGSSDGAAATSIGDLLRAGAKASPPPLVGRDALVGVGICAIEANRL